jgi:hypothetical protein
MSINSNRGESYANMTEEEKDREIVAKAVERSNIKDRHKQKVLFYIR